MQNDDNIQEFSGFDTVSLFGLLMGVIVLVWSLVGHAMHQEKLTKAQVLSEQIAIRMLSVMHDSEPKARRPASKGGDLVDNIDRDPWGRPFHYRKMLDPDNRLVIVVYSAGPNRRLDTKERDFKLNSKGRLLSVHFSGDDVGTIQKSWQ